MTTPTIPTMAANEAPPTVRALIVTPIERTRLVVVRCPYCRRKHTHGWPLGQTAIGHRLAHCYDRWARPGRGYRILPPDNYEELTP